MLLTLAPRNAGLFVRRALSLSADVAGQTSPVRGTVVFHAAVRAKIRDLHRLRRHAGDID